jgi:hypothetical protein
VPIEEAQYIPSGGGIDFTISSQQLPQPPKPGTFYKVQILVYQDCYLHRDTGGREEGGEEGGKGKSKGTVGGGSPCLPLRQRREEEGVGKDKERRPKRLGVHNQLVWSSC